jgi:hypothetical protein
MANYRKSFNFRNGVQVDNDNFVVTGSGLVGIGTSLPQNHILDVYGDTRISGLATVGSLSVSETVKVGSGITMDSTSGIISATAFYGDGSNLTDITIESASTATYADSAGISTYAETAGIATALENSRDFSVSGDVLSHTVSFNGTSNVALGVTLSSDFSANTSGIITSTGGFYGDLTGVASTATELQNSRNFSVSGDVLSHTVSFNGTSNVALGVTLSGTFSANTSGIITSTGGFYGDLTGVASTATELQNSRNFSVSGDVLSHTISFDGTGDVGLGVTLSGTFSANTSGIITSTGGFYGNLTGIASTATELQNPRNFSVSGDVLSHTISFDGTGDVGLGVTLSSDFSANTTGIITASTLDSTNLTTGSIEVESENSTIEVIGSNSAYISIGFTSPTVGIGSTYASLSFSDTDLLIRNYDIGSINSYLQVGGPGLTTGRFNWYDGDTNTLLMALTHEGKLGIGITNPEETFEVVGTSTVTTDSYVGNDLFVGNDLNVTGSITGNFTLQDPITSKVNATGVSTFSSINIFGSGLNQLGIGTDDPQYDIDATGKVARFGSVAISTDNAIYNVDVGGGVRATDGFLSYGTNPVQIGIQTVGEGVGLSTYLVFTVVGIGSTSFLLS